jgi:ring-1,2-phenylacetyl-CoA epoxidase subunit PaaD
MYTIEKVHALLEEISDPEIPVVSIIDLGLVRNIQGNEHSVIITITPTFIGCPALHVIKDEIIEKLKTAGFQKVDIIIAHSPQWSSDWITPSARQKMKIFGIAPPEIQADSTTLIQPVLACCPYCNSQNTTLKNAFGPTLCRMILYCEDCQQPFEQFKSI